MTDGEKLELLDRFAKFLDDEIIVDDCDGSVCGCMSCEAVEIKRWVLGTKELYDDSYSSRV